MPNRIIKESICTSDNLAALSAEAERLFYRLMTQCDDFGLMLANPNIVKSRCFQLTSDAIKEKQMISWLDELESARLIFFYDVDGKRYLKYTNWDKHQQRRAQNPKYPLPEHGSEVVISDDIICMQVPEHVPESSIREANTRSEKREAKTGQARPTLDEVTAYCSERGSKVNPQRWYDYYTSVGWKVGRNPMIDWKAAVRTWENKGNKENRGRGQEPDRRNDINKQYDEPDFLGR